MRESPVKPGTRWGLLTVKRLLEKNEQSQTRWQVQCACGALIPVWGYNLVKGLKTHCGCQRKKRSETPAPKAKKRIVTQINFTIEVPTQYAKETRAALKSRAIEYLQQETDLASQHHDTKLIKKALRLNFEEDQDNSPAQ